MMDSKRSKKNTSTAIILTNLFLACCIILAFYIYTERYHEKLHRQNITDITNINQSVAKVSYSFYNNQKTKMEDIVQYIQIHKTTVQDALTFISEANSDVNANYEMISTDQKGFVSVKEDGIFQPVSYTSSDYTDLKKIFVSTDTSTKDILCTPEFTDQFTAVKCFGLYRHILLEGKNYTLMAVYKSSNFADLIALTGGYTDCSTILIDSDGDYVFGSSKFKSSNLFHYFYDYNGLSLDQMNADIESFQDGTVHIFYYKNSQGKNCVYVTAPVQNTDWYAVTGIPEASFHNQNIDLFFSISITSLLVIMMAFNMIWLKHANNELKTSVAREAEANSAKTDFLSRMSHDIRTPLNVIIGSVYLAQKEKNPETTSKYLNNINENSKFLSSLVNDILDLNKVEVGKMDLHPEPYSLLQLRNSLEAIIHPLCNGKGQTLALSGMDSTDTYLLDPIRINQIFFNLLSNSVKYTQPGGQIGLSCTVSNQKNGSMELYFRVFDNGEGMSEEFQSHMFEAFSQETRSENKGIHGTGLGLAIVNNLVKLMHGTIRVESELDKGTSFYITLPVEKTASTKMQADEAVSLTILQQKKVLLCEDNVINAELASSMLKEKGMIITIAQNGQQAVDLFQKSSIHEYDVILMDMQMPVKNGIEATIEIRALPREDAKQIPILAMTANAYDADVQHCLDAGMNGHISKPIDPERMYQMIAKAL